MATHWIEAACAGEAGLRRDDRRHVVPPHQCLAERFCWVALQTASGASPVSGGQAPRVQESVLGGYAEKVHGACLHFGRRGGRFEIAFGASRDLERIGDHPGSLDEWSRCPDNRECCFAAPRINNGKVLAPKGNDHGNTQDP